MVHGEWWGSKNIITEKEKKEYTLLRITGDDHQWTSVIGLPLLLLYLLRFGRSGCHFLSVFVSPFFFSISFIWTFGTEPLMEERDSSLGDRLLTLPYEGTDAFGDGVSDGGGTPCSNLQNTENRPWMATLL